MATQPENLGFVEGIYQFEPTDVIEGGAGGIDNLPLKQLASRTRFLKEGLDSEVTARNSGDVNLQDQINLILPFIPVKRGYVSGFDGGTGMSGSLSTNFTSAVYQAGTTAIVRVTMPTIGTTNYYLRIFVRSGGTFDGDTNIGTPVYKIISATQFDISIRELSASAQNLRLDIEVVKL